MASPDSTAKFTFPTTDSAHTLFDGHLGPAEPDIHGNAQKSSGVIGSFPTSSLLEQDASAGAKDPFAHTKPPETQGFGKLEDNDAQQKQTLSKKWLPFKKDMKRLSEAVEEASALPISEGEAQTISDTKLRYSKAGQLESPYINLVIHEGPQYAIPWQACFSWRRMLLFLKTWFKDDEKVLADIADGKYTIKTSHHLDPIYFHESTWEQVVNSGDMITFSLAVPSSTWEGNSYSAGADDETKDVPETAYETRLQYAVNYYRQSKYPGESDDFERKSVYDEPADVESDIEYEELPALEEVKDVTIPRDAPSRTSGKKGTRTRAKLRKSDRIGTATLKINSLFLLNIVWSIIDYSSEAPEGDNEGLTAGIFKYPFQDLYHHMDALESYKTDTTGLRAGHSTKFNQRFDEHFDLLKKYLDSQTDISFRQTRAKWERNPPVTSFASIWLLLKPGADVYVKEAEGSLNAYVIDKVIGGVKDVGRRKVSESYIVEVWHLVHGTKEIRPWMRRIIIPAFDNNREITSLPVFPVAFIDDHDGGQTKAKLIARGQKYFEYSKRPHFLQYTGISLRRGKSYKRARVVVDHGAAPWERPEWGSRQNLSHHYPTGNSLFGQSIRMARCECRQCRAVESSEDFYTMRFADYHSIKPGEKETLTAHQCMLMTSHMFAFILKDREIDLLDVGNLEDALMVETAITRLVMEERNKDIIKAIAKTYTENTPSGRFSADFISGKGEGQIILLHGPPGTGKTLTAESVAEYTKRPLISITAADLGHEPERLERGLVDYFKMAHAWDAIILLDEADVYLEQRSPDSLERNSIVSVFLRTLDYFQGILFLTTNRVGHFDEAFISRIHISLGYAKLDNKARGQIWDNLFLKLKEDYKNGGERIEFEINAKKYAKHDDVMSLEWNGREIRNAFQTAVALAVYDAKHNGTGEIPTLTMEHLEQVVAMSSAFTKYIEATHESTSNSDRAYLQGSRIDDIENTPSRPQRLPRHVAGRGANTT